MLAVLVFLAVGLMLVSVNQRRIGGLLRIEQARQQADDFREGPVHVMSLALELLETGLPPSNPFNCGATIDTSAGPQSFAIVFASSGGSQWSVEVAPTDDVGSLDPMPASFAE